MMDAIGKPELARMLAAAAMKIREQHALLSQLDSVAGDGDHGTTMLRVADCLEGAGDSSSVDETGPVVDDLGIMLCGLGWSVMGVDGGASSALLGTFFTGMGEAVAGKARMDCEAMAGAFESGLRALASVSGAQPGDKTMIDALDPAVKGFRAATARGDGVTQAMEEAADAAAVGAEATKTFSARFGRAKFLGEKTLGSADAGAVSIALLFRGFYGSFANERKS